MRQTRRRATFLKVGALGTTMIALRARGGALCANDIPSRAPVLNIFRNCLCERDAKHIFFDESKCNTYIFETIVGAHGVRQANGSALNG